MRGVQPQEILLKTVTALEQFAAPSGVYIEGPERAHPRVFLEPHVYGEAIRSFVIVCTDTVIIDRAHRKMYLARRNVKPMPGWWVIGGRQFAFETSEESVRRCFKRETKLDLPEDRFHYVRHNWYVWKDRQQEPQDEGSHNLAFTYAVELSPDELSLAWASLHPEEYDIEAGLRPFGRDDLIKEAVHPMLVALFDQLFP